MLKPPTKPTAQRARVAYEDAAAQPKAPTPKFAAASAPNLASVASPFTAGPSRATNAALGLKAPQKPRGRTVPRPAASSSERPSPPRPRGPPSPPQGAAAARESELAAALGAAEKRLAAAEQLSAAQAQQLDGAHAALRRAEAEAERWRLRVEAAKREAVAEESARSLAEAAVLAHELIRKGRRVLSAPLAPRGRCVPRAGRIRDL